MNLLADDSTDGTVSMSTFHKWNHDHGVTTMSSATGRILPFINDVGGFGRRAFPKCRAKHRDTALLGSTSTEDTDPDAETSATKVNLPRLAGSVEPIGIHVVRIDCMTSPQDFSYCCPSGLARACLPALFRAAKSLVRSAEKQIEGMAINMKIITNGT
jgi:hypothetical protein